MYTQTILFFFFEKNELDGVKRPATEHVVPEPCVPVISDHFVARRRVAIGPHWRTLFKKRNSECARGSARQHAAPTDAPRLLNATPQEGVSDRALALANIPRNDVVSADHRPPHFTSENRKPGPAAGTHELGVREFLPPPRGLHRRWLREVWRKHRNARRKLKWCPRPAVLHRTTEGLQRQLRDDDHHGRQAPSSPNL